MTRKHRPPHTYLTDMERQNLDILVRRVASHLGPEERALLLRLHGRHLQDARYARDALTGVNSKLDQLRRRAQHAEKQLAEPCVGRPCAGSGCSHEQAGAELAELEAEIESATVAATCGPACSEQHTHVGRCELRSVSGERS